MITVTLVSSAMVDPHLAPRLATGIIDQKKYDSSVLQTRASLKKDRDGASALTVPNPSAI